MATKKPYFVIKVPIFPANIHVCFDEPAFKQALLDKKVPAKVEYLENGAMAETHSIATSDGRTFIGLILDLNAIDDLDSTLVHESVHLVYRIFEYIAEETPGEECRAYLTEYIFKQIKGILDEPSVRKRHREVLDKKNQAVIGALLQMAVDHNGSAGQDSHPKSKDPVRRTKNTNGKNKPKASRSIRRAR
jgi:hypothetical protein